MDQIQIVESSSPESFVMKRIAQNIGLNIRPERAVYDSTKRIWTIQLKAIIPSQVMAQGKPLKTFVYRFENIGKIELTKEDNDFKFLKVPKAFNLDLVLYSRWSDLTIKLEQEILKVGEPVWGQLTYVKMLLRPMYALILHTLTNKKLFVHELKNQPSQEKTVRFLLEKGYLELDERRDIYRSSNFLTGLEHHLYQKYREEGSDFFVTGQIVGNIFSKHYREIKSKLHANAPSVYVDTSTAYYLDAIRMGEPIRMSEEELWKKYRMIGHRPTASKINVAYPTVISEIVAGHLLDRNEDGYIRGHNKVMEKLIPLGPELAAQISEA
jgi:hypothetical protein